MTSNPKEELLSLVTDLRAHLLWLRENGVREVAGTEKRLGNALPEFAEKKPVVSLRAAVRAAVSSKVPDSPNPLTPPTGSAESLRLPESKLGLEKRVSLEDIQKELGDCQRCKLAKTRNRIVFGAGNSQAQLVFVGEGPGEEEDLQGLPFVGAAGQLLTKMIEAMGLVRKDVYICNIVKCRPPRNRNPENDEIKLCEPFLRAQIASVSPKVIVALGKVAAQTLLQDKTPISRLRGSWKEYNGIKLMPTFHPSYLLRSPSEKRKAWEDLQMVMKELGIERKQ
jgi:DNA polymerase